jgi:FlgD Ig-like domain
MRTLSLMSLLFLAFAVVDVRAQCDPPLNNLADGTAIPTPIVISEVNPGAGGYVEFFNTTGAPFNLNGYWLCSPFNYSALPNVNVPAGSYMTVPWPGGFSDTDAGGEMMLYDSFDFNNSNDIIDYVCWGASNKFRHGQAVSVGKWVGAACAPALVNGAIHRLTDTPGTGAASYDVTAAPSPMNCTPPTGVDTTPAYPSIAMTIGPNPFSALATIEFTLSSPAKVDVAVFTVTGARVRRLESAYYSAGSASLLWDGKDQNGRELPSGIYIVRFSGNSKTVSQRVTILR